MLYTDKDLANILDIEFNPGKFVASCVTTFSHLPLITHQITFDKSNAH